MLVAVGTRGAVAVEAALVLRVGEVEDLADQLEAEVGAEVECLRRAHIELRERRAAEAVHVWHAGRQIERVAVAILVSARPVGVRRSAVVAKDAGETELPRRAIEAAHREAMARVSVERAEAGAALRIERVHGLIAHRAEV